MEGAGSRSTWDAAVGVHVTEVHLAALLERPVRLGENSGLIFAEIDDTIADDDVHAVGSNTRRLQVLDHALGEGDVALDVAESSCVMLLMRTRHLLKRQLLDGWDERSLAPLAAPPSCLFQSRDRALRQVGSR